MDRIQSSSSIDLGAPGGALAPSRARDAEEPRRSLGGPAGPWAARRSALAARVLILDGGTATEIARRRLRPARRTPGPDPPPGRILWNHGARMIERFSVGRLRNPLAVEAVHCHRVHCTPPSCGRPPSAAVLPRGRVPGLSRRRGPLSGGDHQRRRISLLIRLYPSPSTTPYSDPHTPPFLIPNRSPPPRDLQGCTDILCLTKPDVVLTVHQVGYPSRQQPRRARLTPWGQGRIRSDMDRLQYFF